MSRSVSAAPGLDRDALARVCGEFGLDLLLLYGSQVSGRVHAESDVDVGYVGRSGPFGFQEWSRLLQELKPYLPIGDVDLVDLRRVPGLLRHVACERGRLLYEARPGEFDAFRVLAWNLYQDERIQLRRYDSEGLRRALERLRA
jgi:predicted nucleotidyltransferase